jgi:hypothetical protein
MGTNIEGDDGLMTQVITAGRSADQAGDRDPMPMELLDRRFA